MKQDAIEAGAVYHIFNRGNNKENLFREEKNYYYFVGLMKKHLLEVADIYCYCMMKNHFHLLLKIKDADSLNDKYRKKPYLPISNMFNAYTKSINKAYGRTGSLFQEHPHRNRVTDQKYFLQLVVYIHLNPVKHHFTFDYKNYPYSSYGDYKSNCDTIVNRDYILSLFGDYKNFEFCHDQGKNKYEGLVEDIDTFDE